MTQVYCDKTAESSITRLSNVVQFLMNLMGSFTTKSKQDLLERGDRSSIASSWLIAAVFRLRGETVQYRVQITINHQQEVIRRLSIGNDFK